MRRVWPIRNRDMIIFSCRDERFEEDHGVGLFLIERSKEFSRKYGGRVPETVVSDDAIDGECVACFGS